VQRRIIRVRAIMTAANFIPAVASRCAKYSDELQFPMLLSAQPRPHNFFLPPTHSFFPMALQDYTQLLERGGLHQSRSTQIPEFLI
jgi:hypothetical protein